MTGPDLELPEPGISVVMTVYNGARFVGAAIESILVQTYGDLELIVVDDASSDETPEILGSIADGRLRVLTNEQNLGLTRSLGRGLGVVRGEYVARQDADDLSSPRRLELQRDFLQAHPAVALVGSSYSEIDESGKALRTRTLPCEPLELRWTLLFQNAFMHGSVLVRTDALRALGGYDPAYTYAQDYDLWSRLSLKYEVANLPQVLAQYRLSAGSMTSTVPDFWQEIHAISRRNVDAIRGPGAEKRSRAPFDTEAAQALLFGGDADVSARRARESAGEIMELQGLFATFFGLGAAQRARHRASVARRLGRATAASAVARGDWRLWGASALLLARAAAGRAEARIAAWRTGA